MDHTWGVAELHRTVDRIVRRHFADEVWVCGEIAGLDRAASGHVYLRLVDHDPDRPAGRSPDAVLHVTLFDSTRRGVNLALQRAGIGRMGEGMQVRVRGQLELYAPSGRVQLRMTGIDASYTLGALEAAREQVLRTLAAEGLVGANAALDLPLLPLRVGLVTSAGSAAAADFLDELRQSGVGFTVIHCDARVQGADAERSVAAALAAVVAREVDLVAVVRGGGDRLDLAAFDSLGIARAIATCPVPVWSGIGHEIDRSVADAVAHSSFKTPTAVAAALVARVREVAEHLDRSRDRLLVAARARAARARGVLDATEARARTGATSAVRHERRHLDARALRLPVAARLAVDRSDGHLRQLGRTVDLLDPRRTMERGWAVLRGPDGRVVRSVTETEPTAR